jgi:hypothetical protein
MVPGVLYPTKDVKVLTDVPLEINKLMKLSRKDYKDFLLANKIAFSTGDSKTTSIDVGSG